MQVGTHVKLKETSKIGDLIFSTDLNPKDWKLQDNPIDTVGTIIKIGNPKMVTLPVIVRWENGLTNSYEFANLIEINE